MGIICRRNTDGSRRYYYRKRVDGQDYLWPDQSRGDESPWRHRHIARERQAEVERAIADGTFSRKFGDRRVPTVSEAGEEWFASGGPREPWTAETKKGYRWVLDRVKKGFGKMLLDEVTKYTIVGYQRRRKKKGVGPSTINRELAALSSIFEYAIDGGAIDHNPVTETKRAREPKGRWIYPDPSAIEKQFLPACKVSRSPHLYALALCWWDAGLRKGEALTLRPENVRFDLFPREDGPPRGAIVALETKNETPRVVPMTERLRDVMLKKVRAAKVAGHEWLFPSPKTGMPYITIGTAFYTARRNSKVAPFRIHDLRHGFGSRLTEEGVQEQWIATLMGHADSQMASRYQHLRPGVLGKAAEALDGHIEKLQRGEVITLTREELERMLERRAKRES